MTMIITSLLVGAAIGEVARWTWAGGGKVQAVVFSVGAVASWALIIS